MDELEDEAPLPESLFQRLSPLHIGLAVGCFLVFGLGLTAAMVVLQLRNQTPLTSGLILGADTTDPALIADTVVVLQQRLDYARIPARVVHVSGDEIRVELNEGDLEYAKPYVLKRGEVFLMLVAKMDYSGLEDFDPKLYQAGVNASTGEHMLLERKGALGPRMFERFDRALDYKGRTAIEFEMTAVGEKRLYQMTSKNEGRRLAIVVDGVVVTAPEIRGRIGKKGIIEGGHDGWQEDDLSVLLSSLNTEPLPVELTFRSQVVVSHD